MNTQNADEDKLEQEKRLRWELSLMHENLDEELKSYKLHLKSLQQRIWELRMKHHKQEKCYIDPLNRELMLSMHKLIDAKQDAIKQLEVEKYQQVVDREKLVVLHKYQESGVEVHHAYSKYIQSENLKSLRDLPFAWGHMEEELEIEVERKSQLKRALEEHKRKNEELISETRKKLEEATSYHHSLQKQVDQSKN